MDEFFARNRLSAWLDGELSAAEAREVEDALARSPALRAELEQLRAAVSLLRDAGRVPAPRGFAERLDERLIGEPMPVGWRKHFRGVRVEAVMLAAAAAVVLVFAAKRPAEPVPDAPEAVAVAEAPTDPAGDLLPDGAAIDLGAVPGVDNPSIATAPENDGVLGGEQQLAKKAAPTKPAPSLPSTAVSSRTPTKSVRTGGAKGLVEKEPYAPAWEQTTEPEQAPIVASPAPFSYRLTPRSDQGLKELAALAASLGGRLTDERGRDLALYPMESGETKKVKLMLPSVNAGQVYARLQELGLAEAVSVGERTAYAPGATVPVVVEITQP